MQRPGSARSSGKPSLINYTDKRARSPENTSVDLPGPFAILKTNEQSVPVSRMMNFSQWFLAA
jgi:hypothetical protein